jgi:hypothetical protein
MKKDDDRALRSDRRSHVGRYKVLWQLLLAAARANELWTEALNNPRFSERVDRLTIAYIPDFNIGATVMLSRLEKNLTSLVVIRLHFHISPRTQDTGRGCRDGNVLSAA